MKTPILMIVGLLLTAVSGSLRAQSDAVPWSAHDGGFATAFAENTRLMSVSGQTFIGSASSGNSKLRSGFLVYPFRSPLSSGIVPGAAQEIPRVFALSQNYPNPFNPSTLIKYTVAGVAETGAGGSGLGARKTSLVVYDVLGRQVATLVDEVKAPGNYEVRFDAGKLASGVYIYRLTAGSFVQTRKMILLK